MDMPPTHLALEQDRLEELRELLAAGADIHEEYNGFTLLHRAVDGEIDGHIQTGEPLHVDATCFLLSQGQIPHVVRTVGPACQPTTWPSSAGTGLLTLSSKPGSPVETPKAISRKPLLYRSRWA